MYKFYYHTVYGYCNPYDEHDEEIYNIRVLFVEKYGLFRIGTSLIPISYEDVTQIKWNWRPNFNGKFTPIPEARKNTTKDPKKVINFATKVSNRCPEDNWFVNAKEIKRHDLRKMNIDFSPSSFE